MLLTAVFWAAAAVPPRIVPAPTAANVRTAVARALPPLVAAAKGHVEQKSCFACHNQTYPLAAFAEARKRGFDVPKDAIANQIDHVTEFLGDHADEFRSGKGTGGQVDTAGAALLALEFAGAKPDDATAAVAEYLVKTQPDRDHWRSTSNRPPTEVSHFTATALAVRGLKTWQTPELSEKGNARIAAARNWLAKSKPADTEDRVYRLIGLRAAKADPRDVSAAAFDLLNSQRRDGGWGQIESMASDPYATATALFALFEAGDMKADHPAARAGVHFLLAAQRADGTWLVRSRSKPFQPYYEGGFPHGKNQFLSSTASGWATAALAMTLPVTP